ncbi:glycosyltransferase family 2 protein [Pontibacter rugosus]|uniref:Glycosyltransferase n=1 Tax=Pontibacter rugosus TaxID=1745966 RepID=A0ABW3SPK4_9BACT
MSNSVSVTILTKNSQKHLFACLSALQGFSEIIVLDNGSTDSSLSIARKFPNVKVIESPFIGFGPLKNLAAKHAANAWILSIDSDEVLSEELREELLHLDLTDTKMAYSIKRNNYYRNKLIKACGWDNDYVLRLYHKGATGFADLQVHEYVRTEGLRVQRLTGILHHYSYDSISQLIAKSDKYTSLFATENRFLKKSSPFKSYYKGAFSFFRNYILQRGFLYGYEGLTISFTNAANSFYKYMKLYEANQTLQISLIILKGNKPVELAALKYSLAQLNEAPNEAFLTGTGLAAEEFVVKIKHAHILVHQALTTKPKDQAQELQEAINLANGEYIVLMNSDVAPAPDLIKDCKLKAKKGTYSSFESNHASYAIAFWKSDLQSFNFSNSSFLAGTSIQDSLAALLSANGLKKNN